MSMMEVSMTKDYSKDGRTKQSFKDETDINKLLVKAAKGGSISHLAKHGAVYGDFSDINDLMTAFSRLEKGKEIFEQLPGELKREFNQSPQEFFNFVNNPENVDRLPELLPQLAEQGNQRVPAVVRTAANQTPEPSPAVDPAAAPEEPPAAPSQ